jgi:peptidoglycan/LPS O-acetylase OafA/YrhL
MKGTIYIWVLAAVLSGIMLVTGHIASNFFAIFYAFWEPFIAWGMIDAWLLVFRRYMNRPSGLWTWLNRRSYAVYIIHPVVLVGISLLLSAWAAPALVKFAVTGTFACAAC